MSRHRNTPTNHANIPDRTELDTLEQKLKNTSPYHITLRDIWSLVKASRKYASAAQAIESQSQHYEYERHRRLHTKYGRICIRWLFGHPANFQTQDPLELFAIVLGAGGAGAAFACRRPYPLFFFAIDIVFCACLPLVWSSSILTMSILLLIMFIHAFLAYCASHQLWCHQHGLVKAMPKNTRWQINGSKVTFH